MNKYTVKEIADIWSDNNKFFQMGLISQNYLKALFSYYQLNYSTKLSSPINISNIKEYEKTTKHETVAFLKEYESKMIDDEAKKYLHQNLTSSDLLDSAATEQHKQSCCHFLNLIQTFNTSLDVLINNLQPTVCIGRTHSKRAEHILLSNRFNLLKESSNLLVEELARSVDKLPSKLSGPMGDSFGINPQVQQNFSEVNIVTLSTHQMQIVPRFYYSSVAFHIANLATVFEKFFTDLRLLAMDEVNELQEGFSKGQAGSSAMPHKKNPIFSERICGLSRVLRSNVSLSLENNTSWFERDISHSSTERIYWPQMWHLICYIVKLATNVIQNLQINYDSIKQNASSAKTSRETLNDNRSNLSYTDAYEASR